MDVLCQNRGEAENVLSGMKDLISYYGFASVADLYDLVGVANNHTDHKYGWIDIQNVVLLECQPDGCVLKLPRAVPLD